MHLRRSSALVAGAALLAAPALASCGFDKGTERVYTPANGVNYREGDVAVLGAVVVAAQPGSGTFVATFSNFTDDDASVDSLQGGGSARAEVDNGSGVDTDEEPLTVDPFDPYELAPGGYVNLAEEGGVPVRGDFEAGDFVTVTVGFSDGDSVELEIPVVVACGMWADLDESAETSSVDVNDLPVDPVIDPSTGGLATDSASPSSQDAQSGEESGEGAQTGEGADDGETDESAGENDAYSCDEPHVAEGPSESTDAESPDDDSAGAGE